MILQRRKTPPPPPSWADFFGNLDFCFKIGILGGIAWILFEGLAPAAPQSPNIQQLRTVPISSAPFVSVAPGMSISVPSPALTRMPQTSRPGYVWPPQWVGPAPTPIATPTPSLTEVSAH